MDFYASISRYYNDIFPFSPAQLSFIKSKYEDLTSKKILDIGCGTGNLSMALAKHGTQVNGIDLNEEMLKKGNAALTPNEKVTLQRGDMLKLGDYFPNQSFDTIICFGNTLVHLEHLDAVKRFIWQARAVCKRGGNLLIQIINYERILSQKVDHLPTIENESIKFERNYTYRKNENRIDFETVLTIKSNDQTISNNIQLLPVLPLELKEALQSAGFDHLKEYGNFNGATFDANNSIPYIVEATKS